MLMLQIVACAVTLLAVWLMGNKHVAGPALNVAAALCFAVVNAYADLWICAAFSATMAAVNARNYIRWRRDARAALMTVAVLALLLMAPPAFAETMIASFYGAESGKTTASGQRFNPHGMTAAHKTLPFGTRLRVCRGERCVHVTINDRGPFIPGRQLDLAEGPALAIGLGRPGHGPVQVTRE
jgi:rare lipoprotein A (peptidoglycan hydrolase)